MSLEPDEKLALGAEAKCALWWRETPPLPGQRVGAIGDFAASTAEASQQLLAEACAKLRAHGCTLAVGPMDGNTWRRYRFVTEQGTEPPFALEPWNPPDWPAWFAASGFSPVAEYVSAINENLVRSDERVERARDRFLRAGLTFRHFLPERWEEELRAIHRLSRRSFAGRFLYRPIEEEEFLALYEGLRNRVRPELIHLAEHRGELVGYLFTIPDFAEAQRDERVRTVVGKTLAVSPAREFAGLGVALTGLLHRQAHDLGYERVIHALQHAQNPVRNMSAHYGRVFRRYALYARSLP